MIITNCRLLSGANTASNLKVESLLAKAPGLLAILFFGLTALTSPAQEVEEVIVVAAAIEEQVLDDTASITALDAAKLADAGLTNIEDVSVYVPNLTLTQTESGTNIVVRGIGSGVNQGFDQSVGLYVDSVPFPRSQMARAPFLDLANVQILRGPQYVRDGNYSLAGSIHLQTPKSIDELSAGLDLRYIPGQNDKNLLLTFGKPLSDLAGIRLAIQRRDSEGFIENVVRDEDNPQSDETLVRGIFTFTPNENFQLRLKVEHGEFETRGRPVEIIQDEKTPDIGQFDFGSGVPGSFLITQDTIEATQNFTLNGFQQYSSPALGLALRRPRNLTDLNNPIGFLSTWATTAIDRSHIPLRTRYDQAANTFLAQDPSTLIPLYAGRSYLEILEDLYLGTGGPYSNLYKPEYSSPSGYIPPQGLTEARADFKRAADADEVSKNESINFTINAEQYLGAHQLSGVISWIEYDYDEILDTDLTALSLLETEQGETYDQAFASLTYKSDEGAPIRLMLGTTYLDSSLEFNEIIRPNLAQPASQSAAEDFINNLSIDRLFTFDPNYPLASLLGRDSQAFTNGLEMVIPKRQFIQDSTIKALIAEIEIDISDTVRSRIGARYTHSEKQASRDLDLVFSDGASIDIASLDQFSPVFSRLRDAISSYGILFGIQLHSDAFASQDRFDFLSPNTADKTIRGKRTEEQLLPSISFEWDATSALTLRAAVRKANKLGGFDARASARPDVNVNAPIVAGTFEFEDEDATSYEVGANVWLPMGKVNATLFYTEFKDLQVSTSDGKAGTNVRNAGEAKTVGMELEGQLQLSDALTMNFSAAWTDFEFTKFPLGSCALGEEPDNVLLTKPFAEATQPLTQFFLQRAFPEIIGENPTSASINAALQAYNDDIRDGGRLEPVSYGSTPFPGDQLSAGGLNALLSDYEFGYIPVSITAGPNSRLPVGGIVNFQAQNVPIAPYQFNNTLRSYAYFCDRKGQTNQYVAEFQGTVSLSYEHEVVGLGLLKPSLDVIYNSGYHTTVTLDKDVYQDEYYLLNGRIALSSFEDIWEIALVGENLTNEVIVSYAGETPIGSRTFGAKNHFGFIRPPRAIGLNLRYKLY